MTNDEGFASFLTEHYGEDAFSVIIIDECHRSAWGKWSEVLKRNPNAIHIGLTATPRQLHESKKATAEDQEITANNRKYFGEPVYEYTLIQAQEDGYLAACEIVKRKASIDNRIFTREEILAAKPMDIRTGKPLTEADLTKDEYTGKDFDDELFIELRTPAMCEDLFAAALPKRRAGTESHHLLHPRNSCRPRGHAHEQPLYPLVQGATARRPRTTTPSNAWAARTTART